MGWNYQIQGLDKALANQRGRIAALSRTDIMRRKVAMRAKDNAVGRLDARGSSISRGTLGQSLHVTDTGNRSKVHSTLPYAGVQQRLTPTIILPVKGKFLAIPVTEQLARAHLWPRDFKGQLRYSPSEKITLPGGQSWTGPALVWRTDEGEAKELATGRKKGVKARQELKKKAHADAKTAKATAKTAKAKKKVMATIRKNQMRARAVHRKEERIAQRATPAQLRRNIQRRLGRG